MEQDKEIKIALKFADIDNKPFSEEHEGWVSCFAKMLRQTVEFYFNRPVVLNFKTESELISEQDFEALDAIIYILSPAFLFSSNIATEISAIEKAVFFNAEYINSKIHKVLKGPVNSNDLPTTISLGTFHYFYQTASTEESTYETLFDWDHSPLVRGKYWESFTNLLFDLLKSLHHEKKDRFIPKNDYTIYLGPGDIAQLWNRTNLLGDFNSRGVKVLPDHDHSIEVKHLKGPVKFYLTKSDLAIHFPEEFLPLDKLKLQELSDLPGLKRYIWFDPESEKELEKKKQYDELKQKLKNLEHVEAISSGIEGLKEIIFATSGKTEQQEALLEEPEKACLYLIFSENISEERKSMIINSLNKHAIHLFILEKEKVHERRIKHYQYLKKSSFCLIYYDGKKPEWLLANINEVKKSVGLNIGKSQAIKLGIIAEMEEMPEEIKENANSFKFISGLPHTLEEDLNDFVNE